MSAATHDSGPGSVLVVVYYFPPWGGGPVLRTLKTTKYLARFGWRVRIVTARSEYYEPLSHDPSLERDIEQPTRVLRTHSLQPRGRTARALVSQVSGARAEAPDLLLRILLTVARRLHGLLVPDDKILWALPAIVSALRWVTGTRVDVVYVSAPPHSSLLVALALSLLLRRPLVVDIRDDWIGNPLYGRASRARVAVEQRMEAAVMKRANAAIVPTEASRTALVSRYPALHGRVHVVSNGFDHEDIEQVRESLTAAPGVEVPTLTCVYAGLLNARRDILPLLRAIRAVHARGQGKIRLTLAGFVPAATLAVVRELGLERDVDAVGYLAHAQILALLLRADVAVVISTAAEGAATAVPSKVYEYVACGAHVLGLVDPGATADLLARNGWGTLCPPDDVHAIRDRLEDLLARKQRGHIRLNADPRALQPYTRRGQAEIVDVVLRSVSGSHARPIDPA